MDVEERLALVTRNSVETVTDEELRALLEAKEHPRAYIGFEPSGLVHLGWVLVAQKIRDLCDAGFEVTIFWADWHAYINDKLGGDMGNIQACARYMEDCFIALGVPRDRVVFRYASDMVSDKRYWEMVINVGKATSLSRVKRAMTIMGRSEDEAEVDASKLFYPILQATDIFYMDVDLCYAGLDQRRAHMLARDAADKLGWRKPIALHTPLLPGLKGGNRMDPVESKMSKSDPAGNISILDSKEDIARKMKKAYCPPEEENEDVNPVMMLCRYIIFPREGSMHIDRPEKYGGPLDFSSYEELRAAYYGGGLSPVDLKSGVTDGMDRTLAPVRAYFAEHPENYEAIKAIVEGLKKLRRRPSALQVREALRVLPGAYRAHGVHGVLDAHCQRGLHVARPAQPGGAVVAPAVAHGLRPDAGHDLAQADPLADGLLGGPAADPELALALRPDERHVGAGAQERPARGGLEAPRA